MSTAADEHVPAFLVRRGAARSTATPLDMHGGRSKMVDRHGATFVRPRACGIDAAAALLRAGGCTTPRPPRPDSASTGASVTVIRVDTRVTVADVRSGTVGVAYGLHSKHANDPESARLLREAGVQLLSIDNGMATDLYDWRTNSLRPDPAPDNRPFSYNAILKPVLGLDPTLDLIQAIGAEAMAWINYGTGTPEEAADWVRYARDKGYPIRYWEIGQSQYFNGSITPDAHADKSATAYGHNALAFIKAMKAVDPKIKVGVGISRANRRQFPQAHDHLWAWNETVLGIIGPQIDFVDAFFYASGWSHQGDAELLAATSENACDVQRIRQLIGRYESPARTIDIIVGETNSVANATAQQIGQVGALYLPDQYLSLISSGARSVIWYGWQVGLMGDREAGFGDLGLLSSGHSEQPKSPSAAAPYRQPPAGTPFRPYFAFKMLSAMTVPGTRLVAAESTDPLVTAYAAERPDGVLAVMIINKDSTSPRTLSLEIIGVEASTQVHTQFYGPHSTDVEEGDMMSLPELQLLPAYSIKTWMVSPTRVAANAR